jgi:hypothetical protein
MVNTPQKSARPRKELGPVGKFFTQAIGVVIGGTALFTAVLVGAKIVTELWWWVT